MNTITSLPYEVALKLLHSLVDSLLGVGLPRPDYAEFSSYWNLPQWLEFINLCSSVLVRSAYSDKAIGQTREEIDDSSVLYKCLVEVVNSRRSDLRRAALDDSLRKQKSYLQDFDWETSLVLGSDKISTIEEPVVSVSLDLRVDNSPHLTFLEFDQSQMDSFITELEKVNKELKKEFL